jgi:hypothetical protein
VLNGVHMVRTCCFENFLVVLIQMPCLALGVTLGSHDILLVRAICFLVFVVVIVVGGNYDPSGAPLLPLFPAFGAFLNTFTSGFGWCLLATARDCFPIALKKDGPNYLLSRGVIEQLLGGLWLIMAKFMH